MNEPPKPVFSRTLSGPPSWANTTFVAEPEESAVPRMKAEPGDPRR